MVKKCFHNHWLVVTGTMEFHDFLCIYIHTYILGISWSRLTFIFFRGVETTNQRCIHIYIYYDIFIGQHNSCAWFSWFSTAKMHVSNGLGYIHPYVHPQKVPAGCRPHPDGNSDLWTSQGLRPALRRLPDQWGDDDVSEKRFEGGRIGFSVFHFKLWMELGFSSVWVCLCFKHFRRVNVQTIQSNILCEGRSHP